MKKLILPMIVLVSVLSSVAINAQVRVNVNLQIGQRPAWGIPGNAVAEYYYFPEIDMYYHIPAARFVYFESGRWLFAASLPYTYRNYDLYRGYKVIINDDRPYLRPQFYRERYGRNYPNYRQPVVVIDRRYDRYDNRWNDRRDDDRYRFEDRRGDDRDRNDRRGHDHGRGHGKGWE